MTSQLQLGKPKAEAYGGADIRNEYENQSALLFMIVCVSV